jgi:hypothetical protein
VKDLQSGGSANVPYNGADAAAIADEVRRVLAD